MKKVLILVMLLAAATAVTAQDKFTVTVKSSEASNGVVILTVQQAATPEQPAESFVLHCNKGMSNCAPLEAKTYLMVRLPKNWGTYDCNNVDLYPSTADPATAEKLGEYCLIQK